jgi:hypothetical protein
LLRLTSTLDRGPCGQLLDDPVCEQADALDLDLDEIVWRDQDRRRRVNQTPAGVPVEMRRRRPA